MVAQETLTFFVIVRTCHPLPIIFKEKCYDESMFNLRIGVPFNQFL